MKEQVLEESRRLICMLSEDQLNERKTDVDCKKVLSSATEHKASLTEEEELDVRIANLETQIMDMMLEKKETQMWQSTQTEETATANESRLIAKMALMERGHRELMEHLMVVQLEYKKLAKKATRAKELFAIKLTKAELDKDILTQKLNELKEELTSTQYKLDTIESTLAIPFTPTILSAIASAAAMERSYTDFYQGQPMPPLPASPNQQYTLPMVPRYAVEPIPTPGQFPIQPSTNEPFIIQLNSPPQELETMEPEPLTEQASVVPETSTEEPINFQTSTEEPTIPETSTEEPINIETSNQEAPVVATTTQEDIQPEQLPMQPEMYEQAPGTYQQLPMMPESYQQLPMMPESYQQLPMMAHPYQQLPMMPQSYPQLPMMPETYQEAHLQTPDQLQAYQQAPEQVEAHLDMLVPPVMQHPGLQPGYVAPIDSFSAFHPGSHRFVFRDVYENRRCRWCWTNLIPRNTVQCANCGILVHNSCKPVMPYTCGYPETLWEHYHYLPVSHTDIPATPSFKLQYPACWVIIHREVPLRRYIVVHGKALHIYKQETIDYNIPHEGIPLQMCGLMPKITVDLTGRSRVPNVETCIAYHQMCLPGRTPGISFILEFGNYWDRETIIDALTSFIASLTPPGPFDHYGPRLRFKH